MKFSCAHCGKTASKPAGHVKRSRAVGMRLFCNRRCAGLGRRKHKTKSQRIEEKRLYDLAYRAKNLAMLKAKKRTYHKATYDPAKARVERKKRAAAHVEYCRRPEYRRWKKGYDRKHWAGKFYGPAADAFLALMDLTQEIKTRSSNYEIRKANGTLNKTQSRRRETNPEGDRHRYRSSESFGLA